VHVLTADPNPAPTSAIPSPLPPCPPVFRALALAIAHLVGLGKLLLQLLLGHRGAVRMQNINDLLRSTKYKGKLV